MADTVFERVLEKAKKKGWTQSDLAVQIRVSPQNLTNWKSRGVPADKYVALADALNCSLDELLGRWKYAPSGEGPPQPWPFKKISQEKIEALDSVMLSQLEVAFIGAAAALGIDIKKPD